MTELIYAAIIEYTQRNRYTLYIHMHYTGILVYRHTGIQVYRYTGIQVYNM